MSPSSPSPRAQAAKVAKWLVERSRGDEALQLLCAFAVSGPNDLEGQQLLADAFRLNPTSPVARMAFERMEGVSGDHADLERAIGTYNSDTLAKLTREMSPNVFRRAQLGFNNNVKYKGQVLHIQTEDSGLDKPHIITHLFADGGRVIKSFRRDYTDHVSRPDVGPWVKALMKGQHMEMVLFLREGKFDEIIEGRARGGMDVLTEPPRTDIGKLAKRGDASEGKIKRGGDAAPESKVGANLAPSSRRVMATPPVSEGKLRASPVGAEGKGPTPIPPPPESERRRVPRPSYIPAARKLPLYALFVERSLHGGPDHYPVFDAEVVIGSAGKLDLNEKFCHPIEAVLRLKDGQLFVEDKPGGNGVFIRIRGRVELSHGDEFLIGDQVFRVDPSPPPTDDYPDPGPTYFYPAPNWLSQFRIVQIFEGGAPGRVCVARGGSVQIGSAVGDIICGDPLVSDQHCVIEEQAGTFVVSDLDSRTGVFVKLSGEGEAELFEGDEIIVGRTRLRVHFTAHSD